MQKCHLVRDVGQGDVVIDLDSLLVVHEQVHDVRHGGRHPTSTLVKELVEPFGTVGVSITGG